MCDIYECEFKLVGRKMANLKLGNILLGGCSVTCLQQKFEDSFDHFSSEMRLGKRNANLYSWKKQAKAPQSLIKFNQRV